MYATNKAQTVHLQDFNKIIKEVREKLIVRRENEALRTHLYEWIKNSDCDYHMESGNDDINAAGYVIFCIDEDLVPLFHSLEVILNLKDASSLISVLKKYMDISESEQENIESIYNTGVTFYRKNLSVTHPVPIPKPKHSYAELEVTPIDF